MNFILSHKVHGQIINSVRQVLKGPIGSMHRLDHHFRLLFRQLFLNFFLKVFFVFFHRTEMTLHGTDKGPSTQGNVIQIILPFFFRRSRLVVVGIGHAYQITRVVNVHTPILSCFVPALVGRIGAEDQQKTQGRARQGERRHGECQDGQVLTGNQGRMLGSFEVLITTHNGVVCHDERRNQGCRSDFTRQVLVHARLEDGQQVINESILRTVLLPIVVRVHGTTKLALFFPRWHVRHLTRVAEGIPTGKVTVQVSAFAGFPCRDMGLDGRGDKGRRTRRCYCRRKQ
mmetsp:Transcript_19743/g.37428  ORF Transcript_19743/g.37428 Transcript_19743/m.37428 type:complete len:286 (-) Transcript_19743:136-993(-)